MWNNLGMAYEKISIAHRGGALVFYKRRGRRSTTTARPRTSCASRACAASSTPPRPRSCRTTITPTSSGACEHAPALTPITASRWDEQVLDPIVARDAGPLVARLYLRLLAVVSLIAWLSMGSQLRLLIGAHGLLPIAPLLDEVRRQHLSFFELPTLFWISASDEARFLDRRRRRCGAARRSTASCVPVASGSPSRCRSTSRSASRRRTSAASSGTTSSSRRAFLALLPRPVRARVARRAVAARQLLLVKLYIESGLISEARPSPIRRLDRPASR